MGEMGDRRDKEVDTRHRGRSVERQEAGSSSSREGRRREGEFFLKLRKKLKKNRRVEVGRRGGP
jgi:hypothetical protein